eukprot:scaffold233_cov243-Pinguiococcus_pyrenoidosus.AAC.3
MRRVEAISISAEARSGLPRSSTVFTEGSEEIHVPSRRISSVINRSMLPNTLSPYDRAQFYSRTPHCCYSAKYTSGR